VSPARTNVTPHPTGRRARRALVYRGQQVSCTLAIEREAWSRGLTRVAGVDEVGRGALFGPVVAGAVILGPDFDPTGVDDSKRLTRRRREVQAQRIRCEAQAWALGEANAEEIDRLGIVAATRAAMHRAVGSLAIAPDLLLIDGTEVPGFGMPQRALVKGDATSISIAAASILAKVARDQMLREWDLCHPGYGLARNAGYGTSEHLAALRRLGPTPLHRRSFGRQGRLFDLANVCATARCAFVDDTKMR
jgi:ribonuclease HII